MSNLRQKAVKRANEELPLRTIFRNEKGAIDLASIMVGIIVIGLIGGVIAATVFAVIPWTQDNAAKQQLDSIVVAESAYKGLASGVPPEIPEGHTPNNYANSVQLEEANLLQQDPSYCVMTVNDGKGYQGFVVSASSSIFYVTDQHTKPSLFSGALPNECSYLSAETDETTTPTTPEQPESPSLPNRIVMTYQSDNDKTIALPISDGEGVATWSDGIVTPLEESGPAMTKDLIAGQEYTVIFEGTAETVSYKDLPGADALTGVTHWGDGTETRDASSAFAGAANLTDVPASIPVTITDMTRMFDGAVKFNDPDIKEWDVSNVEKMPFMFDKATSFTQSLKDWDTSKVQNMAFVMGGDQWLPDEIDYNPLPVTTALTFQCATTKEVSLPVRETVSDVSFTWNDGEVGYLASGTNDKAANAYSRILQANTSYTVVAEGAYNWFSFAANKGTDTTSRITGSDCLTAIEYMGDDTAVTSVNGAFTSMKLTDSMLPTELPPTVTDASRMFFGANLTNANLAKLNTSNLTNMSQMFERSTTFNQNIDNWDVSNVSNFSNMFAEASSFNQPLNSWDMSSATDVSNMFFKASKFNQPIDNWNTSKVTNMSGLFQDASVFNQPIGNWDTSNVTSMQHLFYGATNFNQPVTNWNVGNVENFFRTFAATKYNHELNWDTSKGTTMRSMFTSNNAFNKPVDHWDVSNVTDMYNMFYNCAEFNQPLNNWNTSKVTDMNGMFYNTKKFNQPLNNWDTSNVTIMTSMFNGAAAYSQDISNWNVSKVTNGGKERFRSNSKLTAAQSPFGV